MNRRVLIISLVVTALMRGYSAVAQESPQPATPDRVVGEITAVNSGNKQLTMKTSAGKVFSVDTDGQTLYRRVPAGETSLDKASVIAFTDIAVGDKAIAKGKVMDQKVSAQALIVVSGQEIAQKQMENKADWKKRGIKGTIVGINPATKGLMVRMMTPQGPTPIRISTEGRNVRYLRYGPDAVSYKDAKPSSFDEFSFGDQIRALGDKSPDGRMFFPEEIIAGTFQMVGGLITEVDKEKGELKITDVKTRQPFTVVVHKDSKLRRLPAKLIKEMEENMAAAPPPGSGTMRMITPGGQSSSPPPSQPTPSSPQGGRVMMQGQTPGGGAGPRPGGSSVDYGETVENLPSITLADLKPGDGIIVSSTKGSDPSRATAILLAAGVESFLKSQEENAKRPGFQLDLALPGLGGP